FLFLVWTVTAVLVATGFEWQGPFISYFDYFMYPLHSLFAALLLARCFRFLASRLGVPRPRVVAIAGLAVPWFALALWVPPYYRQLRKNGFACGWPPLPPAVLGLLGRNTAFRRGDVFRGRSVTLAGGRWAPAFVRVPFINHHNYDALVFFFLGNDHRQYGLWY